ncbi:MAG: phosphoribosylformylglycinamidine synthase, partial [Pseudomonadota bacterium]
MISRIEVSSCGDIEDPRGAAIARQAQSFLGLDVSGVQIRKVYKVSAPLEKNEVEKLCVALTDPVSEESAIGRLPLGPCDWIIGVGFRPGVTDNVGRTARVFLCDLLGKTPGEWTEDPQIFSETIFLVSGSELTREHVLCL